MSKQRATERAEPSRRALLAAVGAGSGGVVGCLRGASEGSDGAGVDAGTPADSMTILHAGSLAPPFDAAESTFESEHGVDVTREAQGSVASAQKVIQQGRSADVLGVSDFRLLRDRLLPEHGHWYAVFATNAMAIQYREDSPGADDIGTDNWWEVLTRDGVTVGHSDPAVDPGGYRAVMTQQLGAEPFDGSRLYDQATYEALREHSTVPTGTETNLEAQLEAGELDYAMYYRSVAATADEPHVDLQPEVDLSRATDEYASHYATATVETDSGEFVGAPIAYGVTVPGAATAPERGAQWVAYFGTEPGREALRSRGLDPVEPVVVPESRAEAVPDRVSAVASARSSLGPLEL